MGYQAAPHASLGFLSGLYQFVPHTEGTALLFDSEWLLFNYTYEWPIWLKTYLLFSRNTYTGPYMHAIISISLTYLHIATVM